VFTQTEVIAALPARSALVQLKDASKPAKPEMRDGRVPPKLAICRGCNSYIYPDEEKCPHCGSNVAEMARIYAMDEQRRAQLIEEVQRLIEEARNSRMLRDESKEHSVPMGL
jgi:hypothetical protein